MYRFVMGLAVVLQWACCSQASSAAEKEPNIIVIFTDDHGYSDLSCQAIRGDVRTPNIDRLAASGLRMTAGYVTAPQCVPSRAGLLTGRYQNRFGVESNGKPLAGFDSQRTIAERLQSAGYGTGMIGKWHLGPAEDITEHGFDDVFYQGGSWTNFDFAGNSVAPGTRNTQLYHIDAGSRAAEAFIQRHHNQPFFLYLAYRAPHVPLDATEDYLSRFPGEMPQRRRQALAMLSAVDDGVGRVLASLHRYELEQNTLVFFIGDNGAPLKIHKLDAPGGGPGWDGSLNDPLNGEKGMLSEGGIRVPFVVSWPGHFESGQVYEHPVISLDVAATALAAAGLPPDPELDGVNLIPYLSGQKSTPPHEALFWRWIAQSAIREGKWKYLRGGSREYLFDLRADPEETDNRVSEHPQIVQRLSARLADWANTLDPPGLEIRSMSQTWETYFDHYLDGKTIPPPASARTGEQGVVAEGWIARNSTLSTDDAGVHVHPDGNKPPFLARSRIALAGPVTATIQLKSRTTGKLGLAWRSQGQRDFPSGQSADVAIRASDDWQQVTLRSHGDKQVIHVRLLLPDGESSIKEIALEGADGKSQTWTFAQATAK